MLTGHFLGKARLGHPTLVRHCSIVVARSRIVPKQLKPPVTAPVRAAHPSQCYHRSYRMSSRCQAFVGEKTKAAGEYHSADFDFSEHKLAIDKQLARDPSTFPVVGGVGESMQCPCRLYMACRCQYEGVQEYALPVYIFEERLYLCRAR